MESAEPMRAIPRSDNDAPNFENASTEIDAPIRAIPHTASVSPKRETLLKDKDEPK
jgi:hypothetical protein